MTQQASASGAPAAASGREALAGILDQMVTLTTGYGRTDLAASLGAAKDRLREPDIRVLIVGEYKKGKSSLVNGLLSIPVAPVDDDIATSVPTVVRFGDVPRAVLTREPDGTDKGADGVPVTEEIAVTELAQFVSELGNPGNGKRVRMVDVWVPRAILKSGMVLVDTPGVGGLGSAHTAATLATLPSADAVVFVTDASQELTAAEIDFLKIAQRACPNIVCVMTKIDLYPEWRRMVDLDRAHLRTAGIDARIIGVSSVLRQVALKSESKEINAESGYLDLVAHLRDEVVGRAGDLARRSVVGASIRACDQLERPFTAEREALTDPAGAEELQRRLADAKERAEALRGRGAKWQQTLSDGFGDLQADLDHDLRERMRETTRVAEEALDDSDPADTWDEFATWLDERVTWEVVQNFSIIAERARALADDVAAHFESQGGLALDISAPRQTLEGIATPQLDVKAAKVTTLGFTAVRQAYSNVSMFSMLGNMAHMAIGMTNPITITIGLLSGGKAFRDAKEQQLKSRRQQAKAAVRRFIDDVNFSVGKDFRDTVRHLQRDLRDTFAQVADELQRSTAESLTAVQQAAQADQAQRQQRLQQLDADLKRIGGVKQKLAAMLGGT